MNSKLKATTFLSVAAILTLSLVAIGTMPQAIADRDDDDHDKFRGKPHFVNEECFVTGMAQGILPNNGKDADCKIKAWFNKDKTALKYKIEIEVQLQFQKCICI